MARLGAMILSLTRVEMRVYFYLIKSYPVLVSTRKLTAVALGVSITNIPLRRAYYASTIVRRIKNKLGGFDRIVNRRGIGYYYDKEKER